MIDEHGFARHGLRLTLILLVATSCPVVVALAQPPTLAGNDTRQAEIERLREMIGDKEKQEYAPQEVNKAIWQLGELKAVEAIDDLVALLGFKYPKETRVGGAQDGYRAKMALAKIGERALPALVRVIKDNDISSVEFKNAQFAVMGIFRDRLPEGSKYLREQATEADSAATSARLWAAAQALDDLHATLNASEER